jgi:hypothetical protein
MSPRIACVAVLFLPFVGFGSYWSVTPAQAALGLMTHLAPKKERGRTKDKQDDKHPFPKGPREKEFVEKLGEDYHARYTDHFVVLYKADESVVKDFILRLERTYKSVHRFTVKQGIKIKYPKEKLIVIFCPDYDEYNGHCEGFVGRGAPASAAGLYWSGSANFSIFYDMSQSKAMLEFATKADGLREQARNSKDPRVKRQKSKEAQWYVGRAKRYQQTNNRSVVQHEVAHQLLYNLQVHHSTARNPQWFVEGLATLFEPPPGKSGAGFNVINQSRLRGIRDSFDKYTADDLRKFVGAGATRGGMLSLENYARSWALCYYLLKTKRKQLPTYIDLIKQRSRRKEMRSQDAIADFEKAFGKIDEKFIKRWSRFITSLPFMPDS